MAKNFTPMKTACSVPGCPDFGMYVFTRMATIDGAAREVSKRACPAHKARGAAWLARAHAEKNDAATVALTSPSQKSLFG